jgi:hypothetical protein
MRLRIIERGRWGICGEVLRAADYTFDYICLAGMNAWTRVAQPYQYM